MSTKSTARKRARLRIRIASPAEFSERMDALRDARRTQKKILRDQVRTDPQFMKTVFSR